MTQTLTPDCSNGFHVELLHALQMAGYKYLLSQQTSLLYVDSHKHLSSAKSVPGAQRNISAVKIEDPDLRMQQHPNFAAA